MANFSIIAIRVLPNNPDNIRKVLPKEGGWYLFNQSYQPDEKDNNKLIPNEKYPLKDMNNFFSKNISISAIVGKNGSGKTSVLDFLLRVINNLTERLLQHCGEIERNSAEDFYCINGLNVELYFEMDSKLCCLKSTSVPSYMIQIDLGYGFKQYGKNMDINAINNQIGEQDITWTIVKSILDNFFYTLVVNYSIHAYNKRDYYGECLGRDEYWVNSLFHKNDGYLAPLVITPYRGQENENRHCILDIDKEFNLANSRLSALLLQHEYEQESIQGEGKGKLQDFIDGYQLNWITFHYDDNYVDSKYVYEIKGETKDKKKYNDKKICHINLENENSIFFSYVGAYNLPQLNTSNNLMVDAYKYLIYKTNMISLKYPSYKDFYKIGFIPDFDKNCDYHTKQKIKELVDKIQTDDSHITIKIKQTLHFINQITTSSRDYTKDFEDKDYPINNSQNPRLSSLDNVMATFPPPFFEYKIYFTKEITDEFVEFGKMSSGERQFLFSMSNVLYHIKNLMSVPENDNARVKYKNFNIVLDEIELCFHPEYQREFVNRLIGYLSRMTPTDVEKEKYYFNIILATHSPFILSDIPKCNILYLDEGKIIDTDEFINPFGANINDILKQSFFLNKGFMGKYAQKRINSLLDYLDIPKENDNKSEWSEKSVQNFINLIGEEIIQQQLQIIYNEKFGIQDKKEKEIDTLKRENEQLPILQPIK